MSSSRDSYEQKADDKKGVIVVYVIFAFVAGLVYRLLAEGQLSGILTLSAIFQTLAFSLLTVQVYATGNVVGISAKTLQIEAFSIVCRLCNTTWLNGYVPIDYTGDWLYQAFDFMCLATALWILYEISHLRSASEAMEDELPIARLAIGCAIFSFMFPPDLNDRPVFDGLWMCSLTFGAVAAAPQLWMMAHSKSSIQTLTAHFVGVMGFSRFMIGLYMWYGNEEITSEPWFGEEYGEFNYAAYSVLAVCLVHTVMIGDFIYYYVKNLATSGLDCPLELNEMWSV